MIVLALFSPLAWVRKIEAFKIGFMFGFAMIIVTIITISAFCISMNLSQGPIRQEQILEERGYVPVNYDSYFSTIGFFFFLFEGIGGLMPIMSATKEREVFPYLLCGALTFLCTMYILFGELCYYTFGGGLNKAIIMEMMPADNPIIQVVKILFMLNLVFSYPLTIFITNLILEGFTFQKMKQNTITRKWLKNC
jgi:amino acid permease